MERTHGVTHYNPDSCFGCKVLTVEFGRPTFESHFNHAVGQYVTSWSDFNEKLRRASDDQSARSGIESNYEAVHPSDLLHNRPSEAAPSHLDRLSTISDPTLSSKVDELKREREKAKAEAEMAARSKDLLKVSD